MYKRNYSFVQIWTLKILRGNSIGPILGMPLIITSSSLLKATYPRQNLATIAVHVASRVLPVPLGLV